MTVDTEGLSQRDVCKRGVAVVAFSHFASSPPLLESDVSQPSWLGGECCCCCWCRFVESSSVKFDR